ncbi:hypothetical protein DJ564_03290 [Pseudomonas sp. 31-12]|nr:hypothetical protein DJ564_03290 [Pseudomonas sp. 31-12]
MWRAWRRSPVGASLLAIAVCQSTSMLNEQPQSRAGSLPQGVGVVLREMSVAKRTYFRRKNL